MDIKNIIIPLEKISKSTVKKKKKKEEREKTTKIQSRTWNLTDFEKTVEYQRTLIKQVNKGLLETEDVIVKELVKWLKIKRASYKSQDALKHKYSSELFVSLSDIINLLCDCNLICIYCESEVLLLYEYVYFPKQWTLDRIDNTVGHNANNVVIACLECNLKRRLANKDKFQFGKKITLTKCIKENGGLNLEMENIVLHKEGKEGKNDENPNGQTDSFIL